MRPSIRKTLASLLATFGVLGVGGLILWNGPHEVTFVLTAPEKACSKGLRVFVYRGDDPVARVENVVRNEDFTFPDGHVRDAQLTMHLVRGTYQVRAAFDTVVLDGPPLPLDEVVHVTGSGEIVLRLDGTDARCE